MTQFQAVFCIGVGEAVWYRQLFKSRYREGRPLWSVLPSWPPSSDSYCYVWNQRNGDSKIVYHETVYVKNCSQVVLVSMKQFYHYWPFLSVDYSRLAVSKHLLQSFTESFYQVRICWDLGQPTYMGLSSEFQTHFTTSPLVAHWSVRWPDKVKPDSTTEQFVLLDKFGNHGSWWFIVACQRYDIQYLSWQITICW